MMVSQQTARYDNQQISFGTKAQTLFRLSPLLRSAKILPAYYFSVADWHKSPKEHLLAIQRSFKNQLLIVRSSTLLEDSLYESHAGAFHSILNVNSRSQKAMTEAINNVIQTYFGNPSDQILIQPMLKNIAVSGVILTHTMNDGAPYCVMNYDDESGKTDTITGGTGVNKTLFIHHQTSNEMLESKRVAEWLNMVQELRSIFPKTPLDIEFAQTHSGELYLLQVRPLAVQKNWNPKTAEKISENQAYIQRFIQQHSKRRGNLLGYKAVFGEMTDWNPAEMIGTSPRPLAASLYRYLITDSTWREARATMGYRHPHGEALMYLIAGRPYIDVRNSFNSFLPADLDDCIAEKLVNAYLDRLCEHPELHDKVEFEIAQTVLDFNFESNYQHRFAGVLNPQEFEHFRDAMHRLTQNNVTLAKESTLHQALQKINRLEERQKTRPLPELCQQSGIDILCTVRELLAECKAEGTSPFSVIARHAFMAEALLRSAVENNALTLHRFDAFKRTLETITADISIAFEQVVSGKCSQETFFKNYGHLRPGTYDILSLRYDQRTDLFQNKTQSLKIASHKTAFHLTDSERQALEQLLLANHLTQISPDELLEYYRKAVVGREYAKFVFTRSLSTILELLAAWGKDVGLSREDVSFTHIEQLLDTLVNPIMEDEKTFYKSMAERERQNLDVARSLCLSYLIRDIRDIYVVPLHRSAPNFVTKKQVEGEVVCIDTRNSGSVDLTDKIVCIENADPGFDWIFTRPIRGLITKFGGSNSHMTIRCAEFGLPAAIGCGEQVFARLVANPFVELNCADQIVRPVYHD